MIRGKITPSWNINDFTDLAYKNPVENTHRIFKNYINSGHQGTAIEIQNYFEPNPMPSGVERVKSFFEHSYSKVAVAVNLFTPGCYVPLHSDDYKAYKAMHNVTFETVYRFIVMLEDHVKGQLSQVGDTVINNWSVGDYIGWSNHELHAFYNMSTVNRYALQITALGKN